MHLSGPRPGIPRPLRLGTASSQRPRDGIPSRRFEAGLVTVATSSEPPEPKKGINRGDQEIQPKQNTRACYTRSEDSELAMLAGEAACGASLRRHS